MVQSPEGGGLCRQPTWRSTSRSCCDVADIVGASAVRLADVASWLLHLMHKPRNALAAGCAACKPGHRGVETLARGLSRHAAAPCCCAAQSTIHREGQRAWQESPQGEGAGTAHLGD